MFISSTPPIQGAMAALVKKFRRIPFIYNLQDIFPDSLVGTGLAKRDGILWKIGRVIEDFTYRNADKIIVISQDFKRNIMAKGVPEEKIEVIYNWVDEQAVVHIPRNENKLFEKYHLNPDKFYITYCGNIGLTQNMDLLLEVAKGLSDEENIHFVLVGEGADKKRVMSRVENEQIKNISFLPFQPYEDISHVFSLGDAGLIISKPGVGENSVPSKTWSIMSAECPVIANFDENEIKTILNDNHCGIFTTAGDKEAFKQAILTLYQDRAKAVELGKNGRKFILENLTREIGTKKYVDVVKSVMKAAAK
jgi:glycosyltransferase involved in cell wall biosynthesis